MGESIVCFVFVLDFASAWKVFLSIPSGISDDHNALPLVRLGAKKGNPDGKTKIPSQALAKNPKQTQRKTTLTQTASPRRRSETSVEQ